MKLIQSLPPFRRSSYIGQKTETYEDQEWKWKWKTSGSGKQRAFATPPADEGSAGCTPEAGRVVPEQPETT